MVSNLSEPSAEDGTSRYTSQLDAAGQAILSLLQKAADAAEANNRRVLDTVQELSQKLRAAQDRIAALEAELQLYRGRSERAKEWLGKITNEIEERLIKKQ